jgi:hypothetical protein
VLITSALCINKRLQRPELIVHRDAQGLEDLREETAARPWHAA